MRPRGRGGPIALDALQGRAAGHRHLQLHILTLVLIEVHLTETQRRTKVETDRQTGGQSGTVTLGIWNWNLEF